MVPGVLGAAKATPEAFLETSMWLILLVVLILAFGGGGFYLDGPYRTGGLSLSAVLVIVLIVLLLTGRL